MILSEDRQIRFAHLITDALWNDDLVDFKNEDLALRLAKQAVREFVKEDQEIDDGARKKVASLKRNVTEGSVEWEILYKKYYQEEISRRGKR